MKERRKRAKPKPSKARKRRTKKPAAGPRTFEEVVAANLGTRFTRRASRALRAASASTMREVSVHPDCEGGIHWLVEWGDSDGGCYVTVFDGPLAELRARDYFGALIAGRLRVLREIG
jgi:hypothetical protein